MAISNICLTFFVLSVMKYRSLCDSEVVRVLGKPNIRPIYLNMSDAMEGERVTIYGKFQCPQDSTAEFDSGTIVKFDKVLVSTKNTTECEIVLYYDHWHQFPKLSMRSKSASEYLSIRFFEDVEPEQTEFTGTNCLIGINRTSNETTKMYRSVVQKCEESIETFESFDIGLNKSGEIISFDTDKLDFDSYTELKKYFKFDRSWSRQGHITIYKDKMAADNVTLLYLNYIFQPIGTCTEECIAFLQNWYFRII